MTEKPADHGSADPARDGATPPPADEPAPPRHELPPDEAPHGADVSGSTDDTHVLPPTPEPAAIEASADGSGTLPLPAAERADTDPAPTRVEQADTDPATTELPGAGQAGDQVPETPPTAAESAPPPPPPGGFPPPPPPGGFPPPSGSFFPPPQPTGGAFATKYGLIRPRDGRWFAGVAAAIGRATNTDPVLWRVLLAVLALFGGVGLLVYVVGWLLIPSEGDSASPAEALIGRGQSSTSGPVALGLGILAVIMFGVAFSGNIRTSLLGTAVIVGAVLLVSRGGSSLGRPANTPPPPNPGAPPTVAPAPGAPFAGTPSAPTTGAPFAPPPPPPMAPATGPYPPGQNPPERAFMPPPPAETPGGYRPPFAPHGPYAPHGPFASSSPYAQSLGYAQPPPPQYPGLSRPVPAPKPPRERSRLGRVTLSLACLSIGVLAVVHVSGAPVPGISYVALALAVIGLGLVIGAWLGRARWLIFPGAILAFVLMLNSATNGFDLPRSDHGGNVTWAPTSVSALESSYSVDAGNGTLDLSKVDFRDRSAAVEVRVDVGNLVVILPPDVDADITAKVDGGSADILGQRWSGLGNDSRQVRDNGTDGPGGGQLQLTASVDLGKLEVHR